MRIVKEAEERREEILTCAVRLFAEKGFRGTSVNDILDAVKIAKGTFYYYFKSKEELLDEAIHVYTERVVKRLGTIIEDTDLGALEKLIRLITAAADRGDEFKRDIVVAIHQPGNELLHEKSLIVSVLCLAPLIERVIEEGNASGVFAVAYPRTAAEVILISSQFMFDERFFAAEEAETPRRLREFLGVAECILQLETGSLNALTDILRECDQ